MCGARERDSSLRRAGNTPSHNYNSSISADSVRYYFLLSYFAFRTFRAGRRFDFRRAVPLSAALRIWRRRRTAPTPSFCVSRAFGTGFGAVPPGQPGAPRGHSRGAPWRCARTVRRLRASSLDAAHAQSRRHSQSLRSVARALQSLALCSRSLSTSLALNFARSWRLSLASS